MKFFSKNKDTLSVISKVAKRRIALFVNGEFETNDLKLIEKLKPHFRHESSKISPRVISGLAKFLKLKKEAIEKGVYKKGMKKKDIEETLKGLKNKFKER